MGLAEGLGWSNPVQIGVAVVLAFVFGYALTMGPVLRAGVDFRRATQIALAADTISIVIMEAVDNGFVLLVPGAIDAGLGDAKFWWSIALGFAIAFGPAWAAQRWLIARGRGHAVAHQHMSRDSPWTCPLTPGAEASTKAGAEASAKRDPSAEAN